MQTKTSPFYRLNILISNLFTQYFSSPRDTASYCSDGYTQYFAYFIIGIPFSMIYDAFYTTRLGSTSPYGRHKFTECQSIRYVSGRSEIKDMLITYKTNKGIPIVVCYIGIEHYHFAPRFQRTSVFKPIFV